ncbi:MAG TPA: phosphate ABC transporter ATP-binding protein [Candidatus Syntrophoarchaeum butanivorans]|uniref:Phosphate ABC transporter ATP-binding protein n=1 Tax=Candidatus Syntropharchaeum butanivorans TaxID=1839936 RepID=A0A1F2P430_9EURY|nr:MAG: phosphate ABC transporter, ATP-binding protein [Candidatus Syntrophoarchaeum butanivorans]HDM36209.1 phosphate ABC transporter ATP-binding protein [Candidatus Syntrophoarchaeum butanivorans]HEC57345.1 phosphate ABC transporter ATP-binding protein [Candidatus Syntrophoarchaeum butanivorans]
MTREDVKISTRNLNVYFGDLHAIKNVSLQMYNRSITSIIGPSGCGKSTFLRALNRMLDIIPHARVAGEVILDGRNIYENGTDVVELRRKVGMVFQKPNPFPKSVYDNVAYGPRIHGIRSRDELDAIVEDSLKKAALWDEVADSLDKSAMELSGGQQQRLCIARTLAVKPEVILFDEPCSALDPISTAKIEDLMRSLKNDYTIVIVTHNMQQAARISDYTAFLLMGELIEFGKTARIFERPCEKATEDYITGRFG